MKQLDRPRRCDDLFKLSVSFFLHAPQSYYSGGVSSFIQKFHEITDDLREQGIEPDWSSAAIATAKPYLGQSNFVSLIPYQFSVKINEVEGVVNTFHGLSSEWERLGISDGIRGA